MLLLVLVLAVVGVLVVTRNLSDGARLAEQQLATASTRTRRLYWGAKLALYGVVAWVLVSWLWSAVWWASH